MRLLGSRRVRVQPEQPGTAAEVPPRRKIALVLRPAELSKLRLRAGRGPVSPPLQSSRAGLYGHLVQQEVGPIEVARKIVRKISPLEVQAQPGERVVVDAGIERSDPVPLRVERKPAAGELYRRPDRAQQRA